MTPRFSISFLLLALLTALCARPATVAALAPQSADQAKTAPSIAGKWAMVVSLTSGDTQSTLDLKLDGRKVSGTIASNNGTFPISGEFADGKLTFVMDYNGQTTVNFAGSLKEDGTMTGTMDYGQGAVNWKAQKAVEK